MNLVIRKVLKKISGRRVVRRKLPNRFGNQTLFVTPESSLRYWHFNLGKVDPVLIGSAEELVRKGDVVWDIGANVGLFTFVAGFLAGPKGIILAIEPDLFLASLIFRSLSNGDDRRAKIEILPVAISNEISLSRLVLHEMGRASNYLEGTKTEMIWKKFNENQIAMTVTLDWLLEHFPAPNVVKIDVEGNEDRVFQGAEVLLKKIKPKILCEVSRHAPKISSVLADAGYTLFDAGIKPEERRPLQLACWNLLAYHSNNSVPGKI